MLELEDRTSLLDALRDGVGLKGTHAGCEHGVCGTCTVLLDGEAVRSCLLLAAQAEGHAVTTIEGLGSIKEQHALQRAFIGEQAAQCGYCVAGVIMSAAALLSKNPDPSEDEIKQALERNLCRCGTHTRMIKAVQRAARDMRGVQ